MEPNLKRNNHHSKEAGAKTRPTAKQIQRQRKMLIYPLFFLVFTICIWLIISPGESIQKTEERFNAALPSPQEESIISDKREAYEREAMQRKEQEKMRALDEFSLFMQDNETDRVERIPGHEPSASKSADDIRQPFAKKDYSFRASSSAYEDINKELGSFYHSSQLSDESKEKELLDQIAELERRLDEQEAQKRAGEKELALIEKSYEIAARYMGGGTTAPTAEGQAQKTKTQATTRPVHSLNHNVVSLLLAPMPDSVLAKEIAKPRNLGFITPEGTASHSQSNSISACIYRTVTVTDGGEVCLRLLDAIMVGNYLVPENTVISGVCRIKGQRLSIEISTVQHKGNILPVKLQAYDLDGSEGLSVPGSDEISAAKEIAANMGSGLGSNITISDDAGSQLLSDLGRSAIQGISQYASKKVREIKITLKEGHKVLLLEPMQ